MHFTIHREIFNAVLFNYDKFSDNTPYLHHDHCIIMHHIVPYMREAAQAHGRNTCTHTCLRDKGPVTDP